MKTQSFKIAKPCDNFQPTPAVHPPTISLLLFFLSNCKAQKPSVLPPHSSPWLHWNKAQQLP